MCSKPYCRVNEGLTILVGKDGKQLIVCSAHFTWGMEKLAGKKNENV